LLISFASAAVDHNRMHHVFPSHCAAVVPASAKKMSYREDDLAFEYNGTKNIPLLQRVIRELPSIEEMVRYPNRAALREALDARHPLCYPLLLWLITSSRSHLRRLRPEEQFKQIPTQYQFVMLSSSNAREQRFRQLKRQCADGSSYFFHGSPVGNWHSIVRLGMKTSGIDGVGASGPSIWMAPDFSTSTGYMGDGSGGGWSKSMYGPAINCMAILEVVNDKSKHDDQGEEYIVHDEALISTRFFLVFQNSVPCVSIASSSLPVRDLDL